MKRTAQNNPIAAARGSGAKRCAQKPIQCSAALISDFFNGIDPSATSAAEFAVMHNATTHSTI